MRPFRHGLLGSVALVVWLAACGARSTLSPPSGAGEAGGNTGATGNTGGTSGTTSSSTTSTTSTTTANVLSCPTLVVDGPPLSPTPSPSGPYQLQPWLAATEPDGSRAAFVYYEDFGPIAEFRQVTSVALDAPWGAWPTSLGPSSPHMMSDGFVIGAGHSGTFSLLTTDEPKNASNEPEGMVVWTPSAGIPGAMGQFFDDIPPGSPAFVTSNDTRYLAGFQRVVSNNLYHLSLARISINGPGGFSFAPAATCALAPLAGGAAPLGDGFVVALSNGRPWGKCQTDDLTDAGPSRLQIVTMKNDPIAAELTFEHDEFATQVHQIHVAPSKQGAWVAWERLSKSPPSNRRIQVVQLDAAGAPVTGKVLELKIGNVAMPFAIAAVGPYVAVAAMLGTGPMQVAVLDGDGTFLGQTSFDPQPGRQMFGDVALLGAPDQGRVLLGWSEVSLGNDARVVMLARVACAGP